MRKNDGGANYLLQNQFTKYVQLAVIHARSQYLRKKHRDAARSVSVSGLAVYEDESIESILDRLSKPPDRADDITIALEIKELLESLPKPARDVVFLRIYRRYSFDEIAFNLNMSHDNARNHYYRALRKLKERWENDIL